MTDKPRRTVQAEVRCTPEELDQLHRIAKSRGMTFSGMVRFDYLGLKSDPVATPEQVTMANVLQELKNLNLMVSGDNIPDQLKIDAAYAIQTLSYHLIEKLQKRK